MTFIDDLKVLKEQIPMQKIQDAITLAKGKLPARMTKIYPGVKEGKFVIKRIQFLLRERSFVELGKQEIFERKVQDESGSKKLYKYIVDFNNPAQVKRLKNILTELVDLVDEDATEAKKEAIPGYLDYIVMANA
jgi:hypothetical protein